MPGHTATNHGSRSSVSSLIAHILLDTGRGMQDGIS